MSLHCKQRVRLMLRRVRKAATRVPMPEAAMHEDHRAAAFHHDIRSARQRTVLQAVADTGCAECPPDGQFRTCVAATDRSHVGAPARCGEVVGHEADSGDDGRLTGTLLV